MNETGHCQIWILRRGPKLKKIERKNIKNVRMVKIYGMLLFRGWSVFLDQRIGSLNLNSTTRWKINRFLNVISLTDRIWEIF